jgi:hypothetical protein
VLNAGSKTGPFLEPVYIVGHQEVGPFCGPKNGTMFPAFMVISWAEISSRARTLHSDTRHLFLHRHAFTLSLRETVSLGAAAQSSGACWRLSVSDAAGNTCRLILFTIWPDDGASPLVMFWVYTHSAVSYSPIYVCEDIPLCCSCRLLLSDIVHP